MFTDAEIAYALRAENRRLREENERLQKMCIEQGCEIAKMRHPAEQYDRLADYVIERRLWRGHQGSHTDSVIRRIEELEANERS